jgi:hypothetical protein
MRHFPRSYRGGFDHHDRDPLGELLLLLTLLVIVTGDALDKLLLLLALIVLLMAGRRGR